MSDDVSLDRPLDRPMWNALGGPQAALNVGAGTLRRVDPAYGPFAGAAPGHEADLAALVADGGEVWLVEPHEITPPPGTRLIRSAPLLQMIADGPAPAAADDAEIVPLGEADVPEMTALALATEPGPWGPSTWRYGQFFGLRLDGKLAAMAGERMRPAAGLAEVSGVCTWPEYRGQGLAARLIRRVMAGQRARGDVSFLHSYAGNASAIRLYESLGFRARRAMVATILGRSE